ncbi:MAG: ABC transporter ATP-binding protein [Chloroflexi bacterium]|nr:ABC transporter ATP-binding protein [Chloroflexota bacterium]
MTALLELRDVHTYIGQFHILQGMSLRADQGQVTVLLGRNGAGKTTTLRTILGLTPPRAGQVMLGGQSIAGLPTHAIAGRGIGYVPEDRGVFTDLTVEENLVISERGQGDLAGKADFIFGLFPDLKRLSRLKGGQLSGGQQQMLALARVLVPDNRLILIDEPTKGLAPILVEQVMAALHNLKSAITVLLVEQNFTVARGIGDHCYIVDAGQVVHSGPMKEIAADEGLIQRYLGAGG